ncbi:putative nuclease HARBI1 [Dendronephthya gigantea]|uniref:putative nuclease HARBI1 n=1 Tax=Dendronephthya gigantea TaxID=151771 RepID=UPI001068FA21|nr:putative nuclease HARBI1 [Dendronephthya gigantea]
MDGPPFNLFRVVYPRQERTYRPRNLNVIGFNDSQLRARYRFGRNAINYITNLLYDDLVRDTQRGHALSPDSQVLIALRFYATGSFLQVVGDTFGVDKGTVSRVVRDVSLALNRRQQEFIKWPTNVEIADIKNNFFALAGFPCVIGCIDCTHIRIQAPYVHENNYVNRKRYHSINVQGICDHEDLVHD